MASRGSIWHAAASAALVLGAALPGCWDSHGRDVPPPALDAGSPVVPDAATEPDAIAWHSMPSLCALALNDLRLGIPPSEISCDGRTFPRTCSAPAGLCCEVSLSCVVEPTDGGHVEVTLVCDDWCDQSCGAQSLDDCPLFPYCERFEPGACGPGPEGVIEGPACITRRGGPCAADADCELGARCAEYWIDPCAGLGCDACGGTERYCTY